MTQINDNMPRQKGKHLTRDERIQIKTLHQKGDSNRAIARAIGCHRLCFASRKYIEMQ